MKTEITSTSRHVTVTMTHAQARALWRLVDFANHDGDCKNWHRDAGAKPAEIRAMGEAMELAGRAANEQRDR